MTLYKQWDFASALPIHTKVAMIQSACFLHIKHESHYLPLPLSGTIGQPEKQHKGSANRKRKSGWTGKEGVLVISPIIDYYS